MIRLLRPADGVIELVGSAGEVIAAQIEHKMVGARADWRVPTSRSPLRHEVQCCNPRAAGRDWRRCLWI